MLKDGREVAGLYELGAEMRDQGVPSHWTSYVTVADVDASAVRAEELGGTVLAGPFDVMEAGRMASVRDPQGAAIALWQAGRHPGARLVNEPGPLSWNDLMTPDPHASRSFYSELFGWRIEEVPGSGGYYWSIHNGESANGGLLPLDGVPAAWKAYFATDDLDAAIATVTEAGGAVLMPPREVGGALRGRTRSAGSGVLAVRGATRPIGRASEGSIALWARRCTSACEQVHGRAPSGRGRGPARSTLAG